MKIIRLSPFTKISNMVYISLLLMAISCNFNEEKASSTLQNDSKNLVTETEISAENDSIKNVEHHFPTFLPNDFMADNMELDAFVDQLYEQLSTKEKAAQMVFVAEEKGGFYKNLNTIMTGGYAGGLLYLKLNRYDLDFLARSYEWYPEGITKTLFCADAEPSLIRYKFIDYPDKIPNTTDIQEDEIEEVTLKINDLLHQYKVKLNFGTLGDLGKNKAVINNRAWGKTPQEIIEKTAIHIQTSQNDSIGATLKHYPGHGNIEGDSHKNLVWINGALSELNTFETILSDSKPFALMIGHIAIKNNPEFSSNLPATMNKKLLKSLKYKGLIVTDALNMHAIKNLADKDFKSLEAGCDIALMPDDPIALNKRIAKVIEGKDSELKSQFENSIKKVIRYKVCFGLINYNKIR